MAVAFAIPLYSQCYVCNEVDNPVEIQNHVPLDKYYFFSFLVTLVLKELKMSSLCIFFTPLFL